MNFLFLNLFDKSAPLAIQWLRRRGLRYLRRYPVSFQQRCETAVARA